MYVCMYVYIYIKHDQLLMINNRIKINRRVQ